MEEHYEGAIIYETKSALWMSVGFTLSVWGTGSSTQRILFALIHSILWSLSLFVEANCKRGVRTLIFQLVSWFGGVSLTCCLLARIKFVILAQAWMRLVDSHFARCKVLETMLTMHGAFKSHPQKVWRENRERHGQGCSFQRCCGSHVIVTLGSDKWHGLCFY